MNKQDIKHIPIPLMYKGFILKRDNNKVGAVNYSTGIQLNPIYDTFENIKIIIDSLK